MKTKFKEYFKNICLETSKLSTCVSKQVGAVLVKDNRIIAIGYNGVPSGKKHCNVVFDKDTFDREEHHAWSKLNEYHSEENILLFCLRNGINVSNSELITTLSPCINCAKLICNAGIKKVYYVDLYDKDKEGVMFLVENGVEVDIL